MPHPDTDAVHAGEAPDPVDAGVNQAIVQSSTYRYPEAKDGSVSSHIYSRYDNPTVQAVECKIAALEGVPDARALLFASGMGAEAALFHHYLRRGDTVAIARGSYGGTMAILADEFVPSGVKVHAFDATASVADAAFPAGTKLVWLESITNPMLKMPDVAAWATAAHAAGALLVVDATFATPVVQQPLLLGADVVVHSGTKYMNGHSDITAGALVFGPGVDAEGLWTRRRNLGATLDPMAAYLLGRGLKTLPLRMEAHQANATHLAGVAASHDGVKAVHYPGVSGVVTLDLGTLAAAVAFRRALRLMTPAASLGGVESLVSLPLETSHAYSSPESRAADGITDGLVRISVGIEDVADLEADLLRGLDAARNA